MIELATIAEVLGKVCEGVIHIFRNRKGRIAIKEIKKHTDDDINDALELYEKLFEEEDRIVPSDLVRWLKQAYDSKSKNQVHHNFLIAKFSGKVVGLLKTMYCPETNYVFISYFGVDKTDVATRRVAGRMMLKLFKAFLARRWKGCEGIVFEIEPNSSKLSKVQKTNRRSKVRLFKDIARYHGLEAFEILAPYCQPKSADSFREKSQERKMVLMIVPSNWKERVSLSKEEFEKIMEFVFMKIYGTTQYVKPLDSADYCLYLSELRKKLVKDITETVKLA